MKTFIEIFSKPRAWIYIFITAFTTSLILEKFFPQYYVSSLTIIIGAAIFYTVVWAIYQGYILYLNKRKKH